MVIDKLQITHIRNLDETTLYPSPSLNFIVGSNGSGKSSLIEAISLITSARSFRTKQNSKIVNSLHSSFTIFAKINSGLSHYNVGLHRDQKENFYQIRINQEAIHKSSILASYFPQLTISPEQCDLIDGSPERRRSVIDLSLFHVKHDYHYLLSKYRKTLLQRNILLKKRDISQLDHWDSVLCKYAEKIDEHRKQLFKEILNILRGNISDKFRSNLDFGNIEISYSSGWKKGETLNNALIKSRNIDIERGFTHNGPHRADFNITIEGNLAREYLSRGEKKLLQILFTVAQLIHFRDKIEIDPIILMDDIFAELDQQNIKLLFGLVRELGLQLFVTATDLIDINQYIEEGEKLFHVKQGSLTEVVQ
ncbi:MAG: DNA replication and repair protein RecF [Gammaproteobacteria bacterium]|nr:DNA replication and repair protein RecF [Gammaproteobacteria bacterium]